MYDLCEHSPIRCAACRAEGEARVEREIAERYPTSRPVPPLRRGSAIRAERNPGHRALTVTAASPVWVAGTSRRDRRKADAIARREETERRAKERASANGQNGKVA